MPLLPIPEAATGLAFPLLGANFKLSAFSKLADGNHTILAAPFLRLEARDALLPIPEAATGLAFPLLGANLNCRFF